MGVGKKKAKGGGGGGGGGRPREYRTKNKNPTQRCGEKNDGTSAYYACAGPGCDNVTLVKQSLGLRTHKLLTLSVHGKSEQTI